MRFRGVVAQAGTFTKKQLQMIADTVVGVNVTIGFIHCVGVVKSCDFDGGTVVVMGEASLEPGRLIRAIGDLRVTPGYTVDDDDKITVVEVAITNMLLDETSSAMQWWLEEENMWSASLDGKADSTYRSEV